jgi:hypothetical protein
LHEFQNGSWRRLPGAGTHITIGANGEKWHVNSNQAIYRMLPGQDQWQQVSGSLKSIHCTDGKNVAGADAEGRLYRWNGAGWTQLSGSGTHIGITWGSMWVVDTNDAIYRTFVNTNDAIDQTSISNPGTGSPSPEVARVERLLKTS